MSFAKLPDASAEWSQLKLFPFLTITFLDIQLDYTETTAANCNQDTETELLARGDRCFHKLPPFMNQIFFQLLLSF